MRAALLTWSTLIALGVGARSIRGAEDGSSVTTAISGAEGAFRLAPGNDAARGIAVDEVSPHAPRLLVLDRTRRIFAYRLPALSAPPSPGDQASPLELLSALDLARIPATRGVSSPRGLALSQESGRDVVYFLDWESRGDGVRSDLWRVVLPDGPTSRVDLSLHPFSIGDRETLAVAAEGGTLWVAFDASGYGDPSLRARRGIIELRWGSTDMAGPEFVAHRPDAGTEPARGLASMVLDGRRYLWGTIGDGHVFCADAPGGRGLFCFPCPLATVPDGASWGLGYGDGSLWVGCPERGPDVVHRINVTRNPDACAVGPRRLRRLVMTIRTEPERATRSPGKVWHTYSRPCPESIIPQQGVFPETERVVDDSAAPGAKVLSVEYEPSGDRTSRQQLWTVEYADAPARSQSSRYEIDVWTRPHRKFVYPHRVDRSRTGLGDATYLGDDRELFGLSDVDTYRDLVRRVEEHTLRKYGVPAELDHPYWAARNVLEYFQDHYYYPVRSKRRPAAVDYARGHYDANPGNLKIELSARPYDKTQIIACSGTSVMLTGALRFLGIPARWLGTGTQQGPDRWDRNGNGLLDPEESAPCTNGHRYVQVWLGSHYGWTCFDATPSRPDANDFDPPPPLRTQWRYMSRAAAGHMREGRVVFNAGSELIRSLYRDYEYDEALAVDNNCGGDQRYNNQGRFEKPESWRLASHRIWMRGLCRLSPVEVSSPGPATRVRWRREGPWDRDPEATLSAFLVRAQPGPGRPSRSWPLGTAIPADAEGVDLDLSFAGSGRYRIVLRKDGDPETGGWSAPFDL